MMSFATLKINYEGTVSGGVNLKHTFGISVKN